MIETKIKVGDKVFWVHCSGRVYEATVEELEMCEYQGAVYTVLNSPKFKINPFPSVHYSHVFLTKDKAKDFSKWQRLEESFPPKCEGCKYHFKEATQ